MRYNRKCKMAYLLGFNNNIRCIEIEIPYSNVVYDYTFNNNIRCIEILASAAEKAIRASLITT